jgi:hypothetical protein
MRSHHVIAVAIALVIGFSVKLLFFAGSPAEAQTQITSVSMNLLQMHLEYPTIGSLPEQVIKESF